MTTPTPEEVLKEEEAHVEGLDGTGKDMTRIINMADAVFAFSLTFLVITIVLPQLGGSQKYPDLPSLLQAEWPAFVTYLISFFIIASWWGAHRRIFSPIVRYDDMLIRLNNCFLLVIALTPFLVSVLYDYGPGSSLGPGTWSTELAVGLFATVQVIGGLLLLGIWRHSTRDHRLVEERLPKIWIRRTERGELFIIGVFAISVPVAFFVPAVAELIWIIAIVGSRRAMGRGRSRHSPRGARGTALPASTAATPADGPRPGQ